MLRLSHLRLSLTATSAALLTSVAVAAPAHAAELKGTVSGTPYVVDAKRTAVPMLLSKQTARRAKLKTLVGIVIMPRKTAIATPEGRVLPGRLRAGDRFTLVTTVPKGERSSGFVRLVSKKVSVYRRSKQLSTAELEALIKATRKQLDLLGGQVAGLAGFVVQRFAGLDTDVAGLKSGLLGAQGEISRLGTRVTGVESSLAVTRTDLHKRIAELNALVDSEVNGLKARLTDVEARVGGVEAKTSEALARIAALEGALQALSGRMALLEGRVAVVEDALAQLAIRVSALGQLVSGGDPLDVPALVTTVSQIQRELMSLTTVVSQLSLTFSSTVRDVTALTGQVTNVLTTTIPALQSTATALQTTTASLGAQDTAFAGQLSTMSGQIDTLNSGLALTNGAVSVLQGTVMGLDTTTTGLQTQLTETQKELATLQGTVNTLCDSTLIGTIC